MLFIKLTHGESLELLFIITEFTVLFDPQLVAVIAHNVSRVLVNSMAECVLAHAAESFTALTLLVDNVSSVAHS